MLLGRALVYSALSLMLIGCQTVKFGDIFGNSEKAVSKEEVQEKQVDKHQLLSELSSQTNVFFSFDDEKNAQKALEDNFTKQPLKWAIEGGDLEVTPVKIFEQEKGSFCREYQAKFISSAKEVSVKSNACRQQNGLWIRQ